jgi:hypothetical protein
VDKNAQPFTFSHLRIEQNDLSCMKEINHVSQAQRQAIKRPSTFCGTEQKTPSAIREMSKKILLH